MPEPWIRVHANIAAKPVISRAVSALNVTENEAIGLLVRFWGAVSQNVINGDVSHVTDRQIELWAGWGHRRKRGQFATFVRSAHVDDEGRVNEWDEYAGKLEIRREKDRQRQEERRKLLKSSRGQTGGLSRGPIDSTSRGGHADSPRDVTLESIPARANEDETLRDVTKNSSSSSAQEALASADYRDRMVSGAGKAALVAVLASPGCSQAGILALIDLMLAGERGEPHATPEQMDRALCDYEANGLSSGKFNSNHFRRFVRKAIAVDSVSASANGRESESDPIERWAADRKAREAQHG